MSAKFTSGSVWQRYGFTLGVVLGVIGLRLLLMPYLGTKYPFATLFPTVVLSAMWGGFGPGLLALGLSFGLAWYLGFSTGVPFSVGTPTDRTAMILNFVGATFVCFVASSMRRAKADLRQQQSHLEEIVDQRTRQLGQANELLRREVDKRSDAESRMRAASVAKDSFIAALSHELRTPLNPVLLLASEGAANTRLAAEVRHDFDVIAKNIRLEARLIDDLLDITRIANGKLTFDLQLVEIDKVLTEALAKVKEELDARRIHVVLKLETDRHAVQGDAARLQQVFWNVFKNAAKFTPHEGEITVRTFVVGNQVMIEVADNGIGMTVEELGRVFSPFEQGDHASDGNARQFSGLGLGLSIARTLIEHHAGTIHATSPGRGEGSIFTIKLPLAGDYQRDAVPVPTASVRTTPSTPPFAGRRRILLVEDDTSSRIALARLLARRNYDVISAASAAEALVAAAQHSFAFVISDIGLPEQDGYSLMRELRQRYALNGIALTGYGTREDIANSEAAGFVAHLTKPVNIATLEAAIAEMKLVDQTVPITDSHS